MLTAADFDGKTTLTYDAKGQVTEEKHKNAAGEPIADVASAVGFHDQSHLHRHFTRLVGTTPRRFATGA